MDKVTRQCPQTTTFEEKGEPLRIRTEVPLLTSLTPYRKAKPAHWIFSRGHLTLSVVLRFIAFRAQEVCESRGGRPGLSVLMSLTVSVDVKQH